MKDPSQDPEKDSQKEPEKDPGTDPDRSKVDYSGWANYMKAQAKAKTTARMKALAANALTKAAATTPAVVVDEDEIAGTLGGNDTPANA